MDVTTLAAPGPIGADELPRSTVVVAKLGQFKDRRYGEFGITREHYDSWVRNLRDVQGGMAPIDFDHSPEKGQGTKAAGWITSLELKTGAQLKAQDPDRFARLADSRQYAAADVEWSASGAKALRDKEYRFISPTFVDSFKDEGGVDVGRTLLGAGLTNRPFLKREMPTLALDDVDLRPEFALEADGDPAPASDSRGRMPIPTNIAKALSLPEGADEAALFARLDGAVVLSADEHTDLVSRAEAGDQAVKDRDEAAFAGSWKKALDAGRVAPADEAHYRTLAAADLATTVKVLDSLTGEIVPTEPKGDGGKVLEQPGAGGELDRAALDQKVRTLAAAENIPYGEALDRVVATLEG
jgi:hypothetical protein